MAFIVLAIAIVALIRRRAAERRIKESWHKISCLQSDIASLRREFAKRSDRVIEPEAPTLASPKASIATS
jgi:hypothetical protein